MFSLRKRKKVIKAVFWVLTIALGMGLIGSSVIWTAPDKVVKETTAPQETVDAQIAKAAARKDAAALLSIGGQCQAQNDTRHATAAYQRVLDLAPDNTAARLSLVELYFMNNEYDQALAQAEAILKKNPDHQKALYYRGLIRGFGEKDYAGAIADLKRFIGLAKSGQEVEEAKDLIKEWATKR
ncbi:tetratricopeptide repeat protein [Thermodesulfitimonas sp.]